MKNMKEIATEIAKAEGKKTQARIGEVREILGLLSDMIYLDVVVVEILINNGKRRAKKK